MCRDDKRNFTERYKVVKTTYLTFLTPQDSFGICADKGELKVEHTEQGCTFYYTGDGLENRESVDIVHPHLENMIVNKQIERIDDGTVSE